MAHKQSTVPIHHDAPPQNLTYEEFLDWADEDTYAEWVNGAIIMMSPASKRHQQIVDFLTKILGIYVEQNDLGVVLSAPFQMKLENGRKPDVLFVRADHQDRLQDTHLDGPADLVVEIVSPESVGRDRGDKFVEYEAGGVPEYWLIDPEREQAEFYNLDDAGRYRPAPLDEDGIYHSPQLTDFWLRVDWLWQEPLPRTLDVLRALDVIQ